MRTGIAFALGAAAGAAVARLVSRERAHKVAATASSGMSAAQTQAHHATNKMKGVAHAVTPHRHEEMDDQTLADRVRSEIFRAHDAPKGDVSVDVQAGAAYLRGEVATTTGSIASAARPARSRASPASRTCCTARARRR